MFKLQIDVTNLNVEVIPRYRMFMNVNEINSCLQLKERVSFRWQTGVRVSLYVLLPRETLLGRIRLPQLKLYFVLTVAQMFFGLVERDFT